MVKADDPNAHFKRYTGVRPKMADSRFPSYAPERDFGRISDWLTNLYYKIQTQSLDVWMPIAVSLGIAEDGNVDALRGSLKVAFECIVAYLEAACGSPIGDRTGKTITNDDELIPFRDAMATFSERAGPAGLILRAMMGDHAMDMLFFAGRQERLIGMEGPATLDKILPTIQRMGDSVRSGEQPEEFLLSGVRRAVEACVALGINSSLIIRVVEQQIIDVQSRMQA